MFKNKESAYELHELLKEICQIIDEGHELVNEGKFTKKERDLYTKNMEEILGNQLGELLTEIWSTHPELQP
jgi:hypothetical protein